MALKPDRVELATDVSFFMNEVAERGGIATVSTVGSGTAMDQAEALVAYNATLPSGLQPVGMLMNDMVNIDQTRQHINFHQDEIQLGGKVTLLTNGWAVTNMIVTGVTPDLNDFAYVAESGLLTDAPHASPANTPLVGQWLSTVDEDGYAKVRISIPLPWLNADPGA